jgi:hypothetical protein
VRVNFNYFISATVFEYIVEAVRFVAEHGWRFLPDYRFNLATGLWRHRRGLVEPPLRLHDLSYDPVTGELRRPCHDDRAPESALADYLAEAQRLAAKMPACSGAPPAGLGTDLEALRWFELPAECVPA